MACASLPSAIFPSGIKTAHFMSQRAAYAAAEAEVLPVEAHMTHLAPASAALEIAIVMPRSLNEPVGLSPSYFRWTSRPICSERKFDRINGVLPSHSETIGVLFDTGRNER